MALAKTLSERIVRVSRADMTRVLPLTAANGLVMAALYTLKPVRNSLFLDRFGVDQVPIAMLLVAAVGALATVAYARLSTTIRMAHLVRGVYASFIVSLLAFRALTPVAGDIAIYLFYLWVALYGLVATSVLWQLANAEFDAREARRLFGLIGTGGIAGAIVGSLVAAGAARAIGTLNLMPVAAVLLCLSLACTRSYGRREPARATARDRQDTAVTEMVGSALLRAIAAASALIAVVAVIADVQFNAIVEQYVEGQDDKTAFFGVFFAGLNVLAIVVQLVVTPRVLTTFGVGVGLLVLPLGLGAGTVALLLFPGLLAGVLPKLADGGLRHSVNKAASEILYIPLPRGVTRRAKLFVDATVDSLFTGLGALMVLFLRQQYGVSYRMLGLLSLVLIALWVVVVLRARRSYVDAFRQALLRRELDFSELRTNISDAATVDALVNALAGGGSGRQLRYALDMLASVQDERLLRIVPELCEHEDPEIRVRSLRVLAAQRRGDRHLGLRALRDGEHAVRVEAVHYLCRHGEQPAMQQLRRLLEHGRVELRAAAVGSIAQYGGPEEHALLDRDVVGGLLSVEGAEREVIRIDVARALASLSDPALDDVWPMLRADPSEAVVRQTIDSAGRTGDRVHLSWLLRLLDDKRYRLDARLALAHYGDGVLDLIDARLRDPESHDRVMRTLPRVLARIDSQRSVEILLDRVEHADETLKRAIIGALEKLTHRFPDLDFDDPRVDDLLWHELDAYHLRDWAELQLASLASSTAGALLLRSLAEKKSESLHRIFQLLSLRYSAKDMASAYRALIAGHGERATSAIELLDNVLSRELKERILPIFERDDPRRLRRTLDGDIERSLQALIDADDGWLRACALYAAASFDDALARHWARRALADRDPTVRQTAALLIEGHSADLAAQERAR